MWINALGVFLHCCEVLARWFSQSIVRAVDHCVYGSGRTIPPSQPPCELLANGCGFLAGARASACEMHALFATPRHVQSSRSFESRPNHWCAPLLRPGPLSCLADRKLLGILTPGGSTCKACSAFAPCSLRRNPPAFSVSVYTVGAPAADVLVGVPSIRC